MAARPHELERKFLIRNQYANSGLSWVYNDSNIISVRQEASYYLPNVGGAVHTK